MNYKSIEMGRLGYLAIRSLVNFKIAAAVFMRPLFTFFKSLVLAIFRLTSQSTVITMPMDPSRMNATSSMQLNNLAVRERWSLQWRDSQHRGPDGDLIWATLVYVDGEPLGYGTGRRKGHAHDMAAKKALETLEQRV
ncbi:hypothetical protein BS47DRAFT_131532 [Hydnum rufescens UP504]|uniref:DRBM domain-containing protein n=1 Tax=Hydnum rufescens UP504 TaxID=1448309 RepID=A0A9P6APN1_9AGAM|nr:hypothetical protein BS47DRAFT_131532 [Hydnum rufescens UP504]